MPDPEVQEDEAKVIGYYENSTLLHVTSLLLLVPSIAYYIQYSFRKRELFAETRPALLRTLLWTTCAFNAFMGCVYYDKWHQPIDAETRLSDKYSAWLKHEQLERTLNK